MRIAAACAVSFGAIGVAATQASAYSGATATCQGASIIGAGSSAQRWMQWGLGADILTGWAEPVWGWVGRHQEDNGQPRWDPDYGWVNWFWVDDYGWQPTTPLASLTTVTPAATDGFGFPYNAPITTWPPPTTPPTTTPPAPATNCVNFRADGKTVHYASIGSGYARSLWGSNGGAASRDTTADFVATDEPLSPLEEPRAESAGLNGSGTQVEQFPVAQVAIAIIVNLPDGCQLHALDGYRQTVLNSYEQLMYGQKSRWGTLLSSKGLDPTPDPDDTPRSADPSDPASCALQPVERVVPKESSGTTFAVKRVLDQTDRVSTGSWPGLWSGGATNYIDPSHNTDWPSTVTKPMSTGDGAVASYVRTHPGSIGFADLATARSHGFDFDGTVDDHTLWLSVTVPASDAATSGHPTYTNDPGKDPYSYAYRDGRPYPYNIVRKGANCSAAPATGGLSDRDYLDLLGSAAPTSTQSNWFNVTGARPSYRKYDYPFCTLTYVLAYDRYGKVPGFPESKARSVYDYVKFLNSTDAQKRLQSLDYQGLPDSGAHPLRPINQAGLGRIQY